MARHPTPSLRAPHLLALEPRVMFDAAAPAAMHQGFAHRGEGRPFDPAHPYPWSDRQDDAGGPRVAELQAFMQTARPGEPRRSSAPDALIPQTQAAPAAAAAAPAAPRQIIFIDTSLADYQQLARDWAGQGQVVLINKDQDGLAQIEAALAGQSGLAAIHIVSHGEEGDLLIGSTKLDEAAITGAAAQELAAIGRALAPGGDLLVYGCDFAEGADGALALSSLATATGADVAASTDLTGYAPLGGDWILEAHQGAIQAQALSDTAYEHTLAPGPVNPVPIGVAADSLTVTDGNGNVVASGANGFTQDNNTDSPNVGAGATARWTDAASQNGQNYDLVATVVSVTPNDYVRFLRPTGPAANNKTGDDPTFTIYDNSGTNNSTGDGVSVQIHWQLVLTGTNTAAPADVTFNILDIDGVGGKPNTRETVSAVASEVYYYTHENVSDIVFNYDAANNVVSASGTQDENNPIPTDSNLSTKSEATFNYQNTSGFTLTYTLAPANGVTRVSRYYQDGDSTFVYTDPVNVSIPHLNLDPDGSTAPDMPTDAHFTFTEKGGAVPVVDSDVLVTNPEDIDSITSGSVTLTNAKAGDVLNVGALPSNITATTATSNGMITVSLSGLGSETDYQNAYRAITFENTSAAPDTTQRVLTVAFTNDANYAASATSRIDVTAVNDPPTNTLPASFTTGEDVPLQLAGLAVSDPDSGAGALTVTLSVPTGTLAASSGGGVTITGSGSGSLVLTGTQDALNAYLASASAPTFTGAHDASGDVTLTMTTNDNGNTGAGGPLIDTDTSTITVTPVNDAPVNTLPSGYTLAEDGGPLALSGISISDVDAGTGVETITLSVPNGTGSLAATSAGNVTASGSGGASIMLTGTLSDLNAYLANAATRPTFTSAPDYNGAVTLTMLTNDNGNTGSGGAMTDTDTSTITVTPVNDAPINTLPTSYTTGEDGGPLSLSGVSISDVDAGAGVETITLSVPTGSGSLAAASAGGVTASGSGGTSVTLNGTLSDLNSYLAGASTRPTFTSAPDYNGAVILTMLTNDNGNTGAGGALTDTSTSTITVTAVNDPPVNTVPANYTTAEDASLSLSGVSVSDVDAGTGLETITFSVPTGAGSLAATSAGGVIASGSGGNSLALTGTLSDLNAYLGAAATRPTFTGAPDASGAVTLTVLTNDNGNTGSGGARTDTSTSTITVTAVNDPPVSSLPSGYTIAEDSGPLSLSGVSVSDVDAGTGVETITLSVPNGSGSLAAASVGGVTASGSGGTSVTLNGTLTDLNTYLGDASTRPTFTSAPDYNGAVTLTMVTNDNGNTGAGGPQTDTDTSTITVTAVNDPPVNTVPSSYTTAEDSGPLQLSGISVSDVDAGTGVETITLSVPNGSGSLAAASAGGVTASGSGGASVTITGTLPDLNSYLADASTRPTFTSAPNSRGAVTLTVTTNDNGATGAGGAQTDTDTSTITITPVNHPPTATGTLAGQSAQDAQPVRYTTAGGFSDIDGDTLTYSATGLPAGLAIDPNSGVISGVLGRSASQVDGGAYAVVVQATDPSGASATQSFALAVTDPAPTARDDIASTRAGAPATITVLANDGDPAGAPLTVTSAGTGAGAPGHGAVAINPDGTITYTPDAGFGGTDSFTYAISDGQGGTASATVAVTVLPNGAPTARPDQAATTAGAPVTVAVLANDSDPNGDPLVVTAAAAAHGTVAINPDGTLTYTPQAGFTGVDAVTYSISDGQGGTAGSTVSVTVEPAANGAPRARPDQAATPADTPVRVAVLANDTDPDGDPLTVTDVGAAMHGAVTRNGDGTLTYTPGAGFTGADSFTYAISDGRGGSATARVDVTVGPAPDAPPIARGDQASTPANTPVQIAVLANDSDPDGDPLTITAVGAPGHGAVALNGDGTLTYTPAAGFTGVDSFTYTISDGRGGSASQVVDVSVGAAGDAPPTARRDQAATPAGTPVIVAVLANDSDPDGDPLVVTGASAANGAVALNPDGTITYTPNAGFTGPDLITYAISDGRGGAAASTVSVAVGGAPDGAPTARPDQAVTDANVPVRVAVLANDTDPDGDPLTVTGAGAAHGAVALNPDGAITYTPDAGFTGVDTITYSISDGRGGAATSTVAVTVGAAPIARPDQATTSSGVPVTVAVLANDTAADGATLTVTAANAAHGAVTVNPDGTLTYTPAAGFLGADTITYSVADGFGGVASSTASVTVDAAPIARPDQATTAPGAPVTVAVLANDTAADGATLTVTAANAAHGAVVVNPDGTLTYTPAAGFLGADTITYSVADGFGGVASSTASVRVEGPFVARPDQATVAPGGSVTVPVLANDTSPDGAGLSVVSASAGHGVVTINPDGTLTYTPNRGFVGADTITYAVADSEGDVAQSSVALKVGRPTADVEQLLRFGQVVFPGAGPGPLTDPRPERAVDLALGAPGDLARSRTPELERGQASAPSLSVHDALAAIRSLNDTAISRFAVDGAVDAVRRLDGTSIDAAAPVAGEVARLDDQARIRDAGDRAFDPRWSDFAPKPLTGFSRAAGGDGEVMFDSVVRGGAIYLNVQDTATDGRAPISSFAVHPTGGGALPAWIRVDPRGLAIIERPADVDELHLTLDVTRRDGRTVRTPVVIQGASGEIELARSPGRDADTPAPPPRGQHHRERARQAAPLDHTLSTLQARRRHEADALAKNFR